MSEYNKRYKEIVQRYNPWYKSGNSKIKLKEPLKVYAELLLLPEDEREIRLSKMQSDLRDDVLFLFKDKEMYEKRQRNE